MQWAEATFQALSFLIPSLRKRFGDFGAINVDVDSSLFSSQAPCAKLAKSSREKLGLGRVSWRQAHGRDWLRHRLAVLEHCLRREFRNLTQDFGVDAASRIFHFRNAQEGGAWAELLHLARLDTHDRVMLQRPAVSYRGATLVDAIVQEHGFRGHCLRGLGLGAHLQRCIA